MLLADRVPLSVGAAMCLAMTMPWVQPAAVSLLINEMGLSESNAGTVISAELTVLGLVPFVLARFVSRIPQRALGLGGGALVVLVDLGSLLSRGIESLLVLRILAGVGAGAVYTVALASLASANDPVRRYGQCFAASVFYGAGLLAVLPFVLNPHIENSLYGVLAAMTLLLWGVLWLLPAQLGESATLGLQNMAPVTGMAAALATVSLMFGVLSGSIWAFMFQIGQQTRLSAQALGMVVSAAAIAGLPGSLIAGWVCSRLGMRLAMTLGLLAFAVPAFLITHSEKGAIFAIGSALCAGSTYFLWPLLLGVAAKSDPSGALSALVGAVFVLGNSLAPAIGGFAIETEGILVLGQASIIGCAVIGAWLIYLVRPDQNGFAKR
jgi:MFS family permease